MNIYALSKIFNKTAVQVLLISLITIITYFNILQNGISYDDRDFLLNWPAVQDSKNGLSAFLSLPDLLAGDLPGHHRGVYRPIRSVYYLVSLKIWGFSPFFFHLQAIIVHSLIVIVIYFITKFLSRNKSLAFMTAALFATHPIHTEAVTYTSASFDTVGILFFFASFYFYLKAAASKERQTITRVLSYLLAFLAFFTYEMTLTLPLLIIFYEFVIKKRTVKNFITTLYSSWPYLALLLGYGVIRILILRIGNRADYLGNIYLVASNQAKIATPEIIFHYFSQLLFPVNLTVATELPNKGFLLFVDLVQSTSNPNWLFKIIEDISPFIPIAIVAIIIFAALRIFKKQFLIILGIGWFLISLLPTLNILPQGTTIAERFLYIPSFGFCLLLSYLITKFITSPIFNLKKRPRLILGSILFILILLSYSSLTIIRNRDWQNEESIFLSAYKLSPTSFIANGALGTIKFEEGDLHQAISYFQTAINITPYAFRTRHQLAAVYEQKEEYDKAIDQYQEILRLENKYYHANLGLGNIYQKLGKFDDAIREYENVLKIDPTNFDAHFNLAGTYLHKKDSSKALNEYNIALNLKPGSAIIYNNKAYIYEQSGDFQKAILEYTKAVEIQPNNFYFHLNLGLVYEKNNQSNLALEEFKKALSLRPENQPLKEKITAIESAATL